MQNFIDWCQGSAIGLAIRDSIWMFPLIEGAHLLALALLGGAVLLVDLRLLDVGLRSQTVSEVARSVRPWMLGALVVALLSGALLFASQARGYAESAPFLIKMAALVVAIVFTAFVEAVAVHRRDASVRMRRAVALVSLCLWTTVGVAGRGIGFW